MATQVFADGELDRLRGFPEIGRDELFRFFTGLRDVRLGGSVQAATFRMIRPGGPIS